MLKPKKGGGSVMGESNVIIYRLIAWQEARENPDGTFTTVELIGNTNQVKAKKVMVGDKEYHVFDGVVE
jgi:hypothetical protein